jgi:hypothetical protein
MRTSWRPTVQRSRNSVPGIFDFDSLSLADRLEPDLVVATRVDGGRRRIRGARGFDRNMHNLA